MFVPRQNLWFHILYVCNCIIQKTFFKKEAAVTLEISPFSQFSLAPCSAGCRLRKTGDSVKSFIFMTPLPASFCHSSVGGIHAYY